MNIKTLSAPAAGPNVIGYGIGVAKGAFTEIIDIIAPSKAAYGDLVSIEARVSNLADYAIYISASGKFNDNIFNLNPESASVGAGETYSFSGSFSMPNHDVRIYVWSYYWTGEAWFLDDETYVDIALGIAPEEFEGSISKKELEYDGAHSGIPVATVPIGQNGLVHIWGRNDMDTAQQMGISWKVDDPDGVVMESYGAWEAWPYTGEGKEHEFIGGRFPLDKPGTYRITVSLYMNHDMPKVVQWYDGPLCTVTGAPPEEYLGTITKKELELDEVRSNIPVAGAFIGQSGLVHIWGRNDTALLQDLGISWVVRDKYGAVVEEYSDWSYGHGAGDDHEFIGGRFDLEKEGIYTLEVGLFMNPGNPVAVDSYEGELCTTTTEVPPEYELIHDTVYHFAYIYDGDVEVTTATFRADPFTPSAWLGGQFASKLEEEVRARGGRPIGVKVYVDISPLLWTNFRIEVISTPIGGTAKGQGIAIGVPIWAAILIVCLAVTAVLVVATLAFETIMERIQHKPGLHEVKPAWGKEALILDIQDAEEYWERTPTPVETLEEMSEAELRDCLDDIADEEVPPEEISPLLIVALVGGCGVLGVGAAAAYAMTKRPG